MVKKIAILMADLTGYTALTETHGPLTAADLIDRYIQIAENCMVDDSRIHERRGDEIMVVSDSPESLLATALKLQVSTASEENFLQVHGGLHFGEILYRADNYFGSTINLVSRIAAKAAPGTFWCSADFKESIKGTPVCSFLSKGNYMFKNITGSKEMFELRAERPAASLIDPVCRMLIVDRKKAIYSTDSVGHYFCSDQCAEIYKDNYLTQQILLSKNAYNLEPSLN